MTDFLKLGTIFLIIVVFGGSGMFLLIHKPTFEQQHNAIYKHKNTRYILGTVFMLVALISSYMFFQSMRGKEVQKSQFGFRFY